MPKHFVVNLSLGFPHCILIREALIFKFTLMCQFTHIELFILVDQDFYIIPSLALLKTRDLYPSLTHKQSALLLVAFSRVLSSSLITSTLHYVNVRLHTIKMTLV